MKKYICFIVFALIMVGCKRGNMMLSNPIAVNYVDSIRVEAEPHVSIVQPSTLEKIKFDEYYLMDERNEKNRFWVFGDSLNKYTNEEELAELAANNKSNAVRFVAFKLLLKRDSHKAIKILIDNIENNDSVDVTHLDQSYPEILSYLMLKLALDRKLSNTSVEDSIAVDSALLHSNIKTMLRYHPYLLKKLAIPEPLR